MHVPRHRKEETKMREFLFRGKRLDNGEWIEGSLFIYDWDNEYVSIYSTEEEMAFQVDPETVGQWTGFRDNDGDRIYEDDILKKINSVPSETVEFYSVKWCGDCGRYELVNITIKGTARSFQTNYGFQFEVIGNIHDNSEMLGDADA